MKKYILLFVIPLLLMSCNSNSLQSYFVTNTESKDFVALDLNSDIINTEKTTLTAVQKESLASFEKMNVLAFQKTTNNEANYTAKKAELKTILKDEKFQELLKIDVNKTEAALYFIGDDEDIDEIVIYANQPEKGFVVVRVLGDNMNPTSILNIMQTLSKSNIDMEQLKPFENLF